MDLAYFSFILASASLFVASSSFVFLYLWFRKFKPIIKRAMSIVGQMGGEAKANNEALKEAEHLIVQGAMDKIPELKLLAEQFPEVKNIIETHPEIIFDLWDKWGSRIEGLLKKKEQMPMGV